MTTEGTILDPFADHPDIQVAPKCLRCGGATRRERTMDNNRNANGGRPYFKCWGCGKVACFGDLRGIHAENPRCHCGGGRVSRIQVAGTDSSRAKPRAHHFTCAVGGCRFFSYATKKTGEVIILARRLPGPDEIGRRGF
jgi:hypothetical protein